MHKGTCLSPGLKPVVVGNREYALEVTLNRGKDSYLLLLLLATAAALTASAWCLVRETPKCPVQGLSIA